MICKVKRGKYYLLYTLAFLCVVLIAFSPFYAQGYSLVRSGDGYLQHTKALAFYSRWIKSFCRSFFSGDWKNLPLWTFSAGYGANVIGTFHYYMLGDPFALVAVFVKQDQIVNLYMVLIFVRMYIAGVVFSELCFYTGRRQTAAVLSGAMCYVFTTNVFYLCVRHPFFIGMMIWFPLILLGAERILKERHYGLFIIAVFFSSVSNVYFFYMTVLYTVIYALWRTVTEFGLHRHREGVSFLLRMAAASVVGLGMSMAILLPVLKGYGSSNRSGGAIHFPDHNTFSWVVRWAAHLMSWLGQNEMGFVGVIVAAVFLLFLSGWKRDRRWKMLALIVVAACYSMWFKYILSAFSYVSGRWLMGLALPVAYLFVVAWDRFRDMKLWQAFCLLVLMVVYVLVSRFFTRRSEVWCTRIEAMLAAVFILLMLMRRMTVFRKGSQVVEIMWQTSVVLIVCFSCAAMGYFRYSLKWGHYTSSFIPYKEVTSTFESSVAVADTDTSARSLLKTEAYPVKKYIGAKNAFRYSSLHGLTLNANVLEGTAADQYYWSMANRNVDKWQREIAATNSEGQQYSGVQGRMMPLALTGVNYVYAEDPLYVPYGYVRISAEENLMDSIYPYYKNTLPLSLGICFDRYITQAEYEKMDAVRRQQALLQGAVLTEEGAPDGIPKADPKFCDEDLPYRITVGEGVEITGDFQFKVTKKGATVHFSFDGKPSGETYLYLLGLRAAEGVQESHFTVTGSYSDGTAGWATVDYLSDDHKWTDHKHDYLVHTGYKEDGILTSFDLVFNTPGAYSFSNIRVVFQPLEEAKAIIRQLQNHIMTNIDFHDDGTTFSTSQVTGLVQTEKKSILFLSIPWEKGWDAYVDGKKTELFQTDTGFSGLIVEKGDHQIRLSYMTPGLPIGTLISLISLVIWIAVLVCERRHGHVFSRKSGFVSGRKDQTALCSGVTSV